MTKAITPKQKVLKQLAVMNDKFDRALVDNQTMIEESKNLKSLLANKDNEILSLNKTLQFKNNIIDEWRKQCLSIMMNNVSSVAQGKMVNKS